jgi:hypothetical protein
MSFFFLEFSMETSLDKLDFKGNRPKCRRPLVSLRMATGFLRKVAARFFSLMGRVAWGELHSHALTEPYLKLSAHYSPVNTLKKRSRHASMGKGVSGVAYSALTIGRLKRNVAIMTNNLPN